MDPETMDRIAQREQDRILNRETAMQRASRIVNEFHHEIGMSVEQAGRLTGAIAHEIERYATSTLSRELDRGDAP